MIPEALDLSREALVKPFEGCARRRPDGALEAYPDPGSGGEPWTIGWGSTGPDIQPGTVWPQEKAEGELTRHMAAFAFGLLRLSPSLMRADDRRLAALVSFAYNVGLGNYRVSTLKKRVDAGDWAGACEQIVKWNKASGRVLSGLTRRRQAEASFLR